MKHIAFTIDKNFVRFCAVTMVSILKNDTPKDLTFHVIGNDLDKKDITTLINLVKEHGSQIFFYQVSQELLNGYYIKWEGKRLPMVVFYRCLLPSILPENIDKVLYLDCDLLVLRPLDELWNTDLHEKAIAGVPDDYSINERHHLRLGYDRSYNYFNGGVLLINLKFWRLHNIEQECKKYFKENPDKILYNDQDLLNGLLHEYTVLADLKWNVQENAYRIHNNYILQQDPHYLDTILHPAILHYSSRKPWQYHCMHPLRELFFKYQDSTPWKGENILNHWKPKLHRAIHLMPYSLKLKKNKYIDLDKYTELS